jgi:hypothetical protein
MLFDLRGRGRRHTVRVIYIGLAGLFLLGFVGFGVGGGFGSSGILSGLTHEEGSGGGGPNYRAEIKKYSKLTSQQPRDFAAWEKLLKAQLLLGGGEAYVTGAGAVTSKGKELFKEISESWSGYVAQNPPKPSLELAKEMVRIYDEEGLDQPSSAVEVLQLIVAAEPTNAAYYASLAEYAYRAKNVRVGDLASEKAVTLTPAGAERTRLKTELAEIKANPSGEKVYTTTTNGKTYAGKLNSKGELAATEVKKTPAKATTTPTAPAKAPAKK